MQEVVSPLPSGVQPGPVDYTIETPDEILPETVFSESGEEGFSGNRWIFRMDGQSFRPPNAQQVRIEERMIIRITPRSSPMRPPDALMDMRASEAGPQFRERKIGKCVPISSISGVRPNGSKGLILFMRDHRIIGAELERSCRARDFYSGFYLAGNTDGRLCVDRDTLLSRSGVNCKLTRIRQLIENDP